MGFRYFFRIFSQIVIVSWLAANIIFSILERDILGIIAFRNIFLLALLICFIYHWKWSTGLLIVLNMAYWYFLVTHRSNIIYASSNNHPVVNFDHALVKICANSGAKMLANIISFLPLIINSLILFYELPLRILKMKKWYLQTLQLILIKTEFLLVQHKEKTNTLKV